MSFIVAVTDYVFRRWNPNGACWRRWVWSSSATVPLDDEIIAPAREVDGVLNCYAKMTARVIEKLKRCKILVRYGMRNRPATC